MSSTVSLNQDSGTEVTRRSFFNRAFDGIYATALATLLQSDRFNAASLLAAETGHAHSDGLKRIYDLTPRRPHAEPKVKAVIHLCMQGGPSQVDLFDPKPALTKYHGKPVPRDITKGATFARDRVGTLMGSPWKLAQHGQSGAWVSELLPQLAKQVDKLAIIRSMFNVHPNHEPAVYKMQSGLTFPGHPTFGSWIVYGLGSENQNLPAYVVLTDP